ncbi:hypothetical protein [Demequina sp.]|uniref:hypothetical protein n=1 Tax=Demequina sp. TaxID=2050685 RepID=UPI003D0D9135
MATAPKPLRTSVKEQEPGAFLYAQFGVHWRAGAASLIPFMIIYFTTQPFGAAVQTLTMGGFIIGPAVLAIFATLWALMSYGLLHRLRFDFRTWVHYTVYAIAGAIGLWLLAIVSLILVQAYNTEGSLDFWNASAFAGFMWASPLLGAVSSIVGRRTLAAGIRWTIIRERPPLPDVFTYVEGKHDRDEFQRM